MLPSVEWRELVNRNWGREHLPVGCEIVWNVGSYNLSGCCDAKVTRALWLCFSTNFILRIFKSFFSSWSSVPDDYRVNPGAVEAIAEHPTSPNKILIGYNRGLLVLWDNALLVADQTYVGTQVSVSSLLEIPAMIFLFCQLKAHPWMILFLY